MTSMQKLLVAAATVALCALPMSFAQAGERSIHPGYYARSYLKFGNGWRLHDAGCLFWSFQNQAWYSRCGLPQNGPVLATPIVVTKY